MSEASVEIKDLVKTYTDDRGRPTFTAVKGINLDIKNGEFMVLVGPSGCGKSTTLRMIAGLERVTSGTISIGSQVVNHLEPKDRGIAMVFQSYALYPHMNIFKNMAYALELTKKPKNTISGIVGRTAKALQLDHMMDRKPQALSGGQRQRVALGRAIVRDPNVFLFDEPLSNLDAKLRVQVRSEIKELHQRLKTTTIYVTHDQIEAMTMADKIVVMHDGRVEHSGAPLQLYDRPANQFVAGFIGSPAMNFLNGKLKSNGSAGLEGPNGVKLPLASAPANSDGQPAVYGVRPEHFTIADDGAEAEIIVGEPTGSETQGFAKLGAERVVAVFRERHKFEPGDKVRLKPDPALVHLFDEATGKRLNA